MDFHALQNKLFEMDPTDPREDFAKMQSVAQGDAAQAPAQESVDYLQESADVPEGSLGLDKDYSISDFAALAGVPQSVNESPMDSFKQGFANYNRADDLPDAAKGNNNAPAAKPAKSVDTKAAKPSKTPTKLSDLSKGDSFKDERGMVWYYNPNQQNWQSKDRRKRLSPEDGFKLWMKSTSQRKRNVREDQIEELESRVAYLESVIESLVEGKQKTGSAGQAKGSDPMPKAKPGRKEHPLKDKLVGETEQESVKEMLYRALNEFEKKK